MAVEKEGFASRWSRRKQNITNETAFENLPEVIDDIVVDEEILAEQRLEKLNTLTDDDMPDIETLNEDSDLSGFMSTGVSEVLRKMALQKLFQGKSYNIRDGLDEYDGDYTSFEKLDPSVITCDMKHVLEVEAEKLLASEKEKEEELLNAEEGEQISELVEDGLNSGSESEESINEDAKDKDENETMVAEARESYDIEFDEMELDDMEGEGKGEDV